jgi:hypothetical protein
MAYLIRNDGERFIIPSYRDVLAGRKPAILKREILLLAENYGTYIYLQKKTPSQYEVAFSNEPGTLLGETVWHFFNRPRDMIYCEAIPNSADAILVIVKGGSVYLDGSFSVDSIPDELVIFQTEENNFEIFLSGDVPISEFPEPGKFSFDTGSVKSFTYLENPIFETLPILKTLQLQPVDMVLQSQGIGVFPYKKLLFVAVLLGLLYGGWLLFMAEKEELPPEITTKADPYKNFYMELQTPDPSLEIQKIANTIINFFSIPGWDMTSLNYTRDFVTARMVSRGMRTNVLLEWAKKNKVNVEVGSNGYSLSKNMMTSTRLPPNSIYNLKEVLSTLIDRMSYILPGNPIKIGQFSNKGKYTEVNLSISFSEITPTTLILLGEQFKKLPLVLSSVTINVTNNNLSGSIELKALGT